MEEKALIRQSITDRRYRYFSESFRKQKVKEIEQGLTRVSEVSKTYQVSKSAIYKWMHKYSTILGNKERVIVESKSDTKRIALLEQKIKELERLVGQKQIQIEFYEKMLEIGKDQYGIDFKKNYGTQPSNGTGKKGKNTDTR